MGGDSGEHIGQRGEWVDVVRLGYDDQAVHGRGALSPAICAAEQPELSVELDAAQSALGGVVAEAGPAIIEEQREAAQRFSMYLMAVWRSWVREKASCSSYRWACSALTIGLLSS